MIFNHNMVVIIIVITIIFFYLAVTLYNHINKIQKIQKNDISRHQIFTNIKELSQPTTPLVIPKYLFVTHETIEKINLHKFREIKRKNKHWNIFFFSNQDRERFLKTYYPDYYKRYQKISSTYGAAKADFWRYIIIYHYGGIYIDSSVEVYQNLDSIIDDKKGLIVTKHHTINLFCANIWGKDLYWNWFFAAPPKNNILEALIKTICKNMDNHRNYLPTISPNSFLTISSYHTFILTGPVIFDKVVVEFEKKGKDNIYKLEKGNIVYEKDKNETEYFIKNIILNKKQTYHNTEQYIIRCETV